MYSIDDGVGGEAEQFLDGGLDHGGGDVLALPTESVARAVFEEQVAHPVPLENVPWQEDRKRQLLLADTVILLDNMTKPLYVTSPTILSAEIVIGRK